MAKKRIDPYMECVGDLGAHEPPAFPENILAEQRGERRISKIVYILAFIIGAFLIFAPEITGFLYGSTNANTDPVAEQDKIGIYVWLNDTMLDNKCPTHDDCDEDPVHFISPGDEIRVETHSAEGQIEKLVYWFPSISLESYETKGDEAYITLPELPEYTITLLWVEATDTEGNTKIEEYSIVYCPEPV